MTEPGSTLTLQDVADLAHVRRPVVSMWRRRESVRGDHVPFPPPIRLAGRTEHFDRADIENYLARTGRGKNRDFALDAPALAVPAGAELEDLVTLLCWHVMTGEDLAATMHEMRVHMAREVDPGDTALLREIEAMAPRADALRYVDDLVEASYGAADALERLESSRLGRERASRDLTDDADQLLREVFRICLAHLSPEAATLRHDNDPGLTLALAAELAAVEVPGDTAGERALRRRATIRAIELAEATGGPRVSVTSLLDDDPDGALDRVDGAVLDLAPGDVAMVVGAASVLCDPLRGARERNRSETLRAGDLTVAMRLPRGLWREAHRQSLGVWVCLGAAGFKQICAADLSGGGLAALDRVDLTADLAAALGQMRGRAFRYARTIELSRVLAGGPVVPRGTRALRFGTSAPTTYADRVHEATLETTEPLAPLDVLVSPTSGPVVVRERSLGELRDRKQLTPKRGTRVDLAHADPAGTVRVLPEELSGGLRLDAIDAARLYPRASRTEPGDVIFVEKPQPRAWVDDLGGALVASPARILRPKPTAGLGPRVLAAVINELTLEGGEWETWNVPELPRGEVARLEQALTAAEMFRAEALARANAAARLAKSLIQGVAAGAVTLNAPPTTVMIPKPDKEKS